MNGPEKLACPPTIGMLGINEWPPYIFSSRHGKVSHACDLQNINSVVLLGPPTIMSACIKCSFFKTILGVVMY